MTPVRYEPISRIFSRSMSTALRSTSPGVLLGGAAGRVVSNAAYTAATDINSRVTAGVDYSEASRQAAVVAAFESVKSSFVWDDQRQRFIAP